MRSGFNYSTLPDIDLDVSLGRAKAFEVPNNLGKP